MDATQFEEILSEKLEESIKLTAEERARLNAEPILNEYQRQKLDKDGKKNWDLFYKRNGNRFFKNRYWTRHEFQELFQQGMEATREVDSEATNKPSKYLLEIGCGCGDFVIPLLGANKDELKQQGNNDQQHYSNQMLPKNLFIYCCDISDKAIEILKANPVYIENCPQRVKAFATDITLPNNVEILKGIDNQLMDIVSLIFVMSSIDPVKLMQAVKNVESILKPGGLVLFRDYAIYDKAMLRFNARNKICDQFYVRQDGTRAYFFSKQELLQLFEIDCNFQCQFIDYVRRETLNNATKDKFSRIFLQAKFKKKS